MVVWSGFELSGFSFFLGMSYELLLRYVVVFDIFIIVFLFLVFFFELILCSRSGKKNKICNVKKGKT